MSRSRHVATAACTPTWFWLILAEVKVARTGTARRLACASSSRSPCDNWSMWVIAWSNPAAEDVAACRHTALVALKATCTTGANGSYGTGRRRGGPRPSGGAPAQFKDATSCLELSRLHRRERRRCTGVPGAPSCAPPRSFMVARRAVHVLRQLRRRADTRPIEPRSPAALF